MCVVLLYVCGSVCVWYCCVWCCMCVVLHVCGVACVWYCMYIVYEKGGHGGDGGMYIV